MSTPIDTGDIQALVFSGHGRFRHSLIVGLRVQDKEAARASTQRMAENEISFGLTRGQRTKALQFLASAPGLAALGAAESSVANLDTAFLEGMVGPQRSRALGDLGRNAPENWRWNDRQLHALALIYGEKPDEVALESKRLFASASGWQVVFEQPMSSPADRREPFGFSDGISVPRINLSSHDEQRNGPELIAPGEVVLGQCTAAGTLLPPPPVGINGTYVVVRQVEQDVRTFWSFWRSQARDDEEAVWLASKALGRWPNGMPMEATSPGPQPLADENKVAAPISFAADLKGRRCPFGAHVRRANPRDGLAESPSDSLETVANHRIIRRGRRYGSAAPKAWYPSGIATPELDLGTDDESAGRGLFFIALCSDVSRQFEFIQQTWINNPKFMDVNDESDAIAAGGQIVSNEGRFTVPGEPVRRRINGLAHWTTIRAGGYFLMPGRGALSSLLQSSPVANKAMGAPVEEASSE
jgi:Dyp-type peroxidase family